MALWEKSGLRKAVGLFFVFGMMASGAVQAHPASSDSGQDTTFSVRLVVDGRSFNLPDSLRRVSFAQPETFSDSHPKLNRFYRNFQELLGRDGYFSASIDSVRKSSPENRITFFAEAGCRYRISGFHIELTKAENQDTDDRLVEGFHEEAARHFRTGNLYNAVSTEQGIRSLIGYWEREGYLFASIRPQVETGEEACEAGLILHTDTGEKVMSSGELFPGLTRNRPGFLQRITGINEGDVVTPRKLTEARQRLEATGLFEDVDDILIVRNEGFQLLYELSERRTNAFDLLFGYIPEPGGNNRFIGSGDLVLRNVFFQGSRLDVSFERLQQFVTKLDLGYEATYLGSTPFGAGARFQFEQQDTLYQVRNMRLNGLYRLSSTTSLLGSLRQEVSVTGNLPAAQQRVFDSRSFFTGVGIRFRQTDGIRNPTRGLIIEVLAETGIKRIDDPVAETFTDRLRWNQREVSAHTRAFISPFSRQVISPSLNGFLMISPEFTETDLNRFGGAKSLRGYREDQFQSARMLWGDVEYRYLLDRLSYAFVFNALGYYERPELIFERGQGVGLQSEWLFSYGLGFSYTTPLGMLQISYALSRNTGLSNGNVHFGISAGL